MRVKVAYLAHFLFSSEGLASMSACRQEESGLVAVQWRALLYSTSTAEKLAPAGEEGNGGGMDIEEKRKSSHTVQHLNFSMGVKRNGVHIIMMAERIPSLRRTTCLGRQW